MPNDEGFNTAMEHVKDILTPKPDSKVIYLDKATSVVECFDAPYYMCHYEDGTYVMVPKWLIPISHIKDMITTERKLQEWKDEG